MPLNYNKSAWKYSPVNDYLVRPQKRKWLRRIEVRIVFNLLWFYAYIIILLLLLVWAVTTL